jgi:hypothetical protein
MATITIRRDSSGAVTFDPPSIKLGAADFVIWANEDPQAEHQPTKQGKAANYWMDSPLPKFEAGQPAATSPTINLAGPAAITYEDGLDPAAGTGTITF